MLKFFSRLFARSSAEAIPINLTQEREASRERISVLSPRSQLEARRQLAGERHNAILERLVTQHSRVLRKKIKRHIRQDEYGKEIGYNEAGSEVAYFISHVAKAETEYFSARQEVIDSNIELTLLGHNRDDFDLDSLTAAIEEEFDLNLVGYVYVLATGEREHDDPGIDTNFDSLSGKDFEIYCEDRLRVLGWSVHRKGGVGDQGVDLIARRNGAVVAIQCKRYASAVGNQAIQQVEAGRQFEEADIAAVVSNNTYTSSAQQLAAKLGVILLHYSELDLLANRLETK